MLQTKSSPLTTTTSAPISWRVLLAILVTVVLWASAFAGIRAGLVSYSPSSVALLRYLFASVTLIVYALIVRMPLPHRRDLPGIAASGLIGIAVYNVALNTGEVHVPAGTASLIVAAAPIFVALLALVFLNERLKMWGWLGILLAFVGVAIISIRPEQGFQLSTDALLVLTAAISQGIYVVTQKPYLGRYSPLQTTACAVWAATLVLLVFLPDLVQQVQTAAPEATLAVAYMGVFPGAVGYLAWGYALARLPASRAGSFLYLVPAAAILIAWLWLGEVPTLPAYLGGAFVLTGVVLVNVVGKEKKARLVFTRREQGPARVWYAIRTTPAPVFILRKDFYLCRVSQ